MVLVSFLLEQKKYTVYGECTVMEKDGCPYPEYTNLKASVMENGKEKPFSPMKNHSVEEMIDDAILASILGSSFIHVEEMDEAISDIVSFYKDDSVVDGKFPKKILVGSRILHLLLATDKYLYYEYDAEIIMFSTESKDIISNNYFAEVGYADSVEDIKNGDEVYLYGILTPEEDVRQISLLEGDGMGDMLFIFETDAPIARLKALEKESQAMDEAPIWADVLVDEGFAFEYVDEHINVGPFGCAAEWVQEKYPKAAVEKYSLVA